MSIIRIMPYLLFCFLSACTDKSVDPNNEITTGGTNSSPPPSVTPTGNFTFRSEPNTGTARCYQDNSLFTGSGKAASISVSQTGYIKHLILGNLPSTGSVSVTDSYDRTGCSNCPVILLSYGTLPYTTDKYYESYSGTITKISTGYSFTAMMIKTQHIGDPNPTKYSLSGTLNCQ